MEVKVNWRVFKSVCKECSTDRQEALKADHGWQAAINQIAAEAITKKGPVMDVVMGIVCVKCQKGWHVNQIHKRCSGDASFDVVLYAIPRRKAVHVTATVVEKRKFTNGDLGKCIAVHEAYSCSSSTVDAVKGFNRARTDSYWGRKKEAATRAIYWYEAKRLDHLYSSKYRIKKEKAKKRVKQSSHSPPQTTIQERLCDRLLTSAQVITGHIEVNADASYWKFPACRGGNMTSAVLNSPLVTDGLLPHKRYLLQLAMSSHYYETGRNQYLERICATDGQLLLSKSFVYAAFPEKFIVKHHVDPDEFEQHKWIDKDGSVWVRIPILYRPKSHTERGEPRWVYDHLAWRKANTTERRLMKAYYGELIDTRDFWFAESSISVGDTGHSASIMTDGLYRKWLEMRVPVKGNRMISLEVIPVSKRDSFDHESIKKTLIELTGVIHKMTTAKTSPRARRLTLEDK